MKPLIPMYAYFCHLLFLAVGTMQNYDMYDPKPVCIFFAGKKRQYKTFFLKSRLNLVRRQGNTSCDGQHD